MPVSPLKYDIKRDCYEVRLESENSSLLPISPNIWQHQLLVSIPKQVQVDHVFLYLSSGDNGHEEMHPQIKNLRDRTNAVVAQLSILTNGPMVDKNSGKRLSEDQVISLSWNQFLLSQNESLLVQLHLQVLVSRVIDVIEDFILNVKGLEFKGLVISGQSKRAQLCWLSASKDNRIKGLIPMVYDLLNIRSNMEHHFKVYGFWADALAAYSEYKIPSFLNTKEFSKLAKLIDPFCFRENLGIPKYIINAANDEYFLPDSSQYYYKSLQGEKGLRYLPNHGHRLEDQGVDYWQEVYAAFRLMLKGIRLPELEWQMVGKELCIRYDKKPLHAYLWQANASSRDFRFGAGYPQFTSKEVLVPEDGELRVKPQCTASKWQAFFVEITYYFPECESKFSLTTDIFISEFGDLV